MRPSHDVCMEPQGPPGTLPGESQPTTAKEKAYDILVL